MLALRCPQWLAEYDRRGWSLPVVDRIHDPRAASVGLQWRSWRGPESILAQLEAGSIEVLPESARTDDCTIE